MKKRNVIVAAFITALVGIMIFQKTNAESKDEKSVAWYAANIKEAQLKNKECRADTNNVQTTPDCLNALHALEISFGVKR